MISIFDFLQSSGSFVSCNLLWSVLKISINRPLISIKYNTLVSHWGQLILKRDDRGDPALTKRFYGFNSLLVLGLGHTKYFKNGSGPCLHGTQHEVGTTRHNFLCDGLFLQMRTSG